MDDAPEPDGVAAVIAAIETDQPCARCGYNLRGLRPDGHCPECGSSIEQSLQGNLLRFADPAWLDRLRLGTTLMIWDVIATGAALFAVWIVAISATPSPDSFFILLPIIQIIGLIVSAIGAAAAVLVTRPEPIVLRAAEPVTLRKVVRLAAVLAVLSTVLLYVDDPTVLDLAGGLLSLAVVVYLFGLLVYLKRMALRVPDEKLAKSTRVLMWGFAICVLLVILMAVIIEVLNPGYSGAMAAACVSIAVMVVLPIWYTVIIAKYNRRFAEAAKFARSNEAAGFRGIEAPQGEKPL